MDVAGLSSAGTLGAIDGGLGVRGAGSGFPCKERGAAFAAGRIGGDTGWAGTAETFCNGAAGGGGSPNAGEPDGTAAVVLISPTTVFAELVAITGAVLATTVDAPSCAGDASRRGGSFADSFAGSLTSCFGGSFFAGSRVKMSVASPTSTLGCLAGAVTRGGLAGVAKLGAVPDRVGAFAACSCGICRAGRIIVASSLSLGWLGSPRSTTTLGRPSVLISAREGSCVFAPAGLAIGVTDGLVPAFSVSLGMGGGFLSRGSAMR